MYKRVLIGLLLLVNIIFARKEHEEEHRKITLQLETARREYADAQAELQRAADSRWSKRQRQVEEKTHLQNKADKIQSEIERMYAIMARVREENIIRQGNLSTVESELAQERESFDWVNNTLDALIKKEENSIRAGFPVGQQKRALTLQQISQMIRNKRKGLKYALNNFNDYAVKNIRQSTEIYLNRESILTAENIPHEAAVMRFGSVFAIGVTDTGSVFYLGSTGGEAVSSFEWVALNDESAKENVKRNMPEWMKNSKVDGILHVDVMQNKYSEELLGTSEGSFFQKIVTLIRAGGIVMIPLGMILLWAIVLTLNRLIVYAIAHSRDNRFIDEAVDYLNKQKMQEAGILASRSKGVLARILKTCLDHAKWKRPVAEKAVKEFLLAEVPVLDKHLDSLAVIAGAAPLLGLLGTVTGMISMFESITRFGTGDPKLLAGGISEALVTTETGLAIAIPVLLVHNFLRNRRNHIQADMEMYAMRILNRLWPQE